MIKHASYIPQWIRTPCANTQTNVHQVQKGMKQSDVRTAVQPIWQYYFPPLR